MSRVADQSPVHFSETKAGFSGMVRIYGSKNIGEFPGALAAEIFFPGQIYDPVGPQGSERGKGVEMQNSPRMPSSISQE